MIKSKYNIHEPYCPYYRWIWRSLLHVWIDLGYGPYQTRYPPNVYHFKYGCGFRDIRTHNERRQNRNDSKDRELKEIYGVYVKRRCGYPKLPSKWDDICNKSFNGKSWKRYTKARKQYMKNFKNSGGVMVTYRSPKP